MRKPTFRAVSLIVCLSMMLSMVPWSPNVGVAARVPEEASDQVASVPVDVAEDALSFHHYLSAPPTSPVVVDAHRTVAEQSAHPEPKPVPVGTPLPPGTVGAQERRYSHHNYLPLITARNASDEEIAVERVDLRTRYAKTYQRPDGSGYAIVSMEPIHYKTDLGNWREIDNSLIQDGKSPNVYRNAANSFEVEMASDKNDYARGSEVETEGALRIKDEEIALELHPQDVTLSGSYVSTNSITYSNIKPDVDLVYSPRGDGVQLEYVLKDIPQEDQAFGLLLQINEGELQLQNDELLLVKEGKVLWRFNLSASAIGSQVSVRTKWKLNERRSGRYDLQLNIVQQPIAYLSEEDCPIVLTLSGHKDFTLISTRDTGNRSANRDAYAQSRFPDTPTGNQFNLYLGYDSWNGDWYKARTRIFARFDNPNLPPGSSITDAQAYFYQYAVEASSTYNTRVCRVTQDWGHYTLTWNNQPNITSCSGYGGTGASVGWKYWTITSFAQAWQSGTSNYGIFLQAQNEYSPGGIYYSKDCSSSQCPGGQRPYMRLEYTLSPVLRIYEGLTPSANPIIEGESTKADFRVRNSGGATFNGSVRAYNKNGSPTFAERSVSIGGNGGTYHYQASQTFNTAGDYQICAQYNDGSWHDLQQDGGTTCRILSVVDRTTTDIRLVSDLDLTPNELDPGGGSVQATFEVHNTTSFELTENFRARVVDGTNFPESGNQELPPDRTYDETASFTESGIYEVIAEHYVNGSWTPLVGVSGQSGNGIIRVKAPPPPPKKEEKGHPPTTGNAGEPVNTSIGNYYYNVTDMSDPTPGVLLDVNRWYNALDASEVLGPFGYGTSWAYDMTVTWRADKTAVVQMPDGHAGYFIGEVNPSDPNDMTGAYAGQGRDTGSVLTRAADDSAMLTTANQMSYHFDTSGRLVRISHPHPADITVTYSGTLPSRLVHSAGVTYTIAYSDSLITSITSSNGRAVTYTYTISDDLETLTRPDGSVYTYFYDNNHRLTEGRTPNDNSYVRNVYDNEGRVVRQYDQTGQESVFTYGGTITGPRVFTDALGHVITHTYDSDYRLIQEEDALGYTTIYTRDTAGNVVARQDKDGTAWHYTYDDQGNMLSETDPLGDTWTHTYDANNNRTSQTNPLGRTWTYDYDANNHLTRVTDPLGYTYEYNYNHQGNLLWEIDKNGAKTSYAYNELGLRTAITDALGNVTQMAYDEFGNQTVYTDANGNAAHFVYDDLNRLVESIDPMGNVITFTYDTMGNMLTESDGMGHLKHYTYDKYDRVIAETDFEGNVTRYPYDTLGRQKVITNALGYTTVYTYDAVGNLAARKYTDGTVTRYEYDSMGRLVREIDPLGRVTEYVYDATGQQVELRRPCDVCSGGVAVLRSTYDAAGQTIKESDARGAVTHYAYDKLGRVSIVTDTYGNAETTTYDAMGNVIQEIDPLGAITRYEYDLLGQLITETNALGYQVVNAYDAVGQRIQVVNARGYTTTTAYDANGRVISTTNALGGVARRTYDAAGNLIAKSDPLSRTTTYSYDANGNRLTETDPRGHTTTYVYDALGRTIEVIEPASCCGGGSRRKAYDAAGRVISETNALGHTTIYTYDVVGRKVAERSPLGYTTVYTYDVADNRIARQDPTGAVWRYEYDANGNPIRQIDPVPAVVGMGNVRETEYDLLNRAIRETDPLGATTERDYGPAGRIIRRTDARGATTRYVYDALGRTVREITPLGHTRVYTYDAGGNRIAEQDVRGSVTTYVYDPLDRQVAQTDPLGHTRYTLYDAAGQVKAEVDYNGNTTTYAYDATGNRIRVTDALSNTTTTEYNARNQPIVVTDPLSRTRYTAYDDLGRVISDTTPLGRTTVYTYNAEGQRIAQQDAQGNVWRTEYDAAGRPVREIDPLGQAETITYDALGHKISQTDALSRTTHYSYDPMGRLLSVTAPDGTSQRYTYDAAGDILTERDGNGHITRYEYDLEGRVIRKTNPLGHRWRYRYDAAGHQVEVRKPSGKTITKSYDALGRLIKEFYDGETFVAFAYDANGNRAVMTDTLGVTTYVYDARNLLLESTDAAGRTVSYTYDAAGQRIQLTYPDGAVATYIYDQDGLLSQVTAPDDGVTTYERDALGRPTLITQGNGVTVERVYDAVGNVLSITQRDAEGDVFARHTYTVDAVGRRVEETETLPQGAITTAYTYDALDRLTASTASDGIVTRYAFDDAGNRTAKWGVREREGITETYRVEYAYSAANQLVQAVDSATGATSYSYDADGNRIGERSFSRQANYLYDAAGHLTEAQVQIWDGSEWTYKDGMSERYLYDGQERRVRKETLSISLGSVIQRREYRYDDLADWNVLQTYDVAATTDTSRFLYDQSLHKLAYWQGDEAGYFQNDSLGSVIGATDADGVLSTPDALMRYGDYGEEQRAESALPTDDGFTGYERDTYTGLDYARYRYYDASTGTFLTPDPYPANHTDVLGLHRYLYVQAEPINAIDPLGLFRWTTSSSGIIERGDTLWGIAADYWGVSVYQVNWGMISAIQNFNSWIKDPNLIYAGYSLKLPTPLSAYEQLKFNQQSTISNGTAGSQCGQLPSSPGGGHQQPGGNNGGGGGTSPGDSGRDPSSDDDGRSDSGKEPNIIDKLGINPRDFKVFSQYSKSVAWTRSFPWEDPHTVKIPPWIPWLGGKKFGIYAEISFYSKTYYKGEIELQPSPDVQYGKCVEIGGSGTLGAEFPVSAVINIGLWGQLGGSLQVCKKAVWHPPNTIKLILEPKGGIQGEIGASLYADVSDPAGVVDAEIGVKGSVSGDFIEREGDLTAGPYVYAAIEVGRWKKAKEWEANPIGLSFKW